MLLLMLSVYYANKETNPEPQIWDHSPEVPATLGGRLLMMDLFIIKGSGFFLTGIYTHSSLDLPYLPVIFLSAPPSMDSWNTISAIIIYHLTLLLIKEFISQKR